MPGTVCRAPPVPEYSQLWACTSALMSTALAGLLQSMPRGNPCVLAV